MNSQSNVISDFNDESRSVAATTIPASRRFYWSVRREFWENHSIYMAPLAVAGLLVFGFLVSIFVLRHLIAVQNMSAEQALMLVQQPYSFAPLLLMGVALLVSIFYCLDALYGERRDRSILFWKALPVSDLTTVLAKASIPILFLPLITFVISVTAQLLMLLMIVVGLLGSGYSASTMGFHPAFFATSMMLLWHLLITHGLWYAPIYCWLLSVSAWARRSPLLWAVLPPVVIGVIEKIAFHTTYFFSILRSVIAGPPEGAGFTMPGMPMDLWSHISPVQVFATPAAWIGMACAAAFLAAAIQLRRYRSPI